MPISSSYTNGQSAAKAQKARRILAGVAREDSDDELGLEDHPWTWIYSGDKNGDYADDDNVDNSDEDAAAILNGKAPLKRKRKATRVSELPSREIVGARMGSFECRIGDTVLLKAETNNEAWVGLICELADDDEGEKVASFMWFSTEKEIRNKSKKRTDFVHNELYITPSWDYNPLASINGKATILSAAAYSSLYPTGKIPRSSKAYGKTFICRRGCNTRTATYTAEFIWEETFQGSVEDVARLIERVKTETKASRKRKGHATLENEEDEFQEGSRDDAVRTPRKKRKVNSVMGTPQKVKTPAKFLTPSHKRCVFHRLLGPYRLIRV